MDAFRIEKPCFTYKTFFDVAQFYRACIYISLHSMHNKYIFISTDIFKHFSLHFISSEVCFYTVSNKFTFQGQFRLI